MGLVLPASRHRVYLSYLPPRLGILSSPPYITTNSHPSSTHLLNTNLLLLSLSLSNIQKYTHRRLQGIAEKTNNHKCYYYLEYPSARFGILFSLCLSSAYVTGKSHHSSHLLKYPSLALALSISLSLTQIYTHRILQNTGEHNNNDKLYYLEYPFPRFGILFSLSVPLCVSLAILTTLPVC